MVADRDAAERGSLVASATTSVKSVVPPPMSQTKMRRTPSSSSESEVRWTRVQS